MAQSPFPTRLYTWNNSCANHGEEYATVEYRGPAVQRQSTTLRRTSGTVLFCVAFVLTIANGSFSVFAESVPSTDSPAFPNCNGTESSIGDGLCDSWSNNAVRMVANRCAEDYIQSPRTTNQSNVLPEICHVPWEITLTMVTFLIHCRVCFR